MTTMGSLALSFRIILSMIMQLIITKKEGGKKTFRENIVHFADVHLLKIFEFVVQIVSCLFNLKNKFQVVC